MNYPADVSIGLYGPNTKKLKQNPTAFGYHFPSRGNSTREANRLFNSPIHNPIPENYAFRHPLQRSGWAPPVAQIQETQPGFREYTQQHYQSYTPRTPNNYTPQFQSPASAGVYRRNQNQNYTPSQWKPKVPGQRYKRSYQQTPGNKRISTELFKSKRPSKSRI